MGIHLHNGQVARPARLIISDARWRRRRRVRRWNLWSTIFFHRYDRLRLLHVPVSVIPAVRDCINNYWYLRLLKQREYHGTTEFKLGGCPWWAEGNDAIESRQVLE